MSHDRPLKVLLLLPEAENAGNVYARLLNERFPQLDVVWVDHHDNVDGVIGSTDILITFSPFMAHHVLQSAVKLQWIQVLGSGVDGIVNQSSLKDEVIITTGQGAQATPVAETALALMFAVSREFPRMVINQQRAHWQRWPSQLLHAHTLGILGVGQIAESLAEKAKVLGMRVVGISSAARAVRHFDQVYARSQLLGVVADLDYLVLLTPYTATTHQIINAAVFAAMKPGAFLINLARGGIVNEVDLVAALKQGIIRGAALDVFEQEPLDDRSELWALPNLIISPHLAGLNTAYPASVMPILEKNMIAFLAGDFASMINRVYKTRSGVK